MRYTVYSSPVSALKMAVTTRDLHLSPLTTLATAIFAFLARNACSSDDVEHCFGSIAQLPVLFFLHIVLQSVGGHRQLGKRGINICSMHKWQLAAERARRR